MSYQVIARKWRPQTFEEVTGQAVITQTLRNALEHDRLHHGYLFSGSRGVGKTTTARILAKALNCHKTDKPNLFPCSTNGADPCPSCVEVSEGRSIDVLEIDAASHTGIDDVRETILESINFNPARDRYKVFIIDEVHQLSKQAFNALLKTLEEPPQNVVFIMATTELHKVPETILSRCQEFEFRTIPLSKIFERLKLIADAEKVNITDDALRELARSGEGSMRDAQSNFDQVISFSGDEITAENVTKSLGFAGVEILSRTMNAVIERDAVALLDVVDNLITRGHDLRNFARDLLGVLRDLLVFKIAGRSDQLLESALFSSGEMAAFGEPFTEADLLRFFNSVAETETKLKEAAHSRHVIEIGLIRLIEMRRVAPIEEIFKRLEALGSGSVPPSHLKQTASATAEKKTLIVEPVAPARHAREVVTPPETAKQAPPTATSKESDDQEPWPDEPPDFLHLDQSENEQSAPQPTIPITPRSASLIDSIAAIPVRLASLSAEELAHVPDERLDNGYEEKLSLLGDDLKHIASAHKLVEQLVGIPLPGTTVANGNGTAVAKAPSREFEHLIPTLASEPTEMPTLSDNPTDSELIEYADAHPFVHEVKRVFRARVVSANRN